MQNATEYLHFVKHNMRHFYSLVIQHCYLLNVTSNLIPSNDTDVGPYCPHVFDGFACWNETKAGTIAYQPCPSMIVDFDSRRVASKICTENGSWHESSSSIELWTNYADCLDVDNLTFRRVVNYIYVGGYSISLIAILFSLGMLLYKKTLSCSRITINRHLFLTFILNNAIWITWYTVVGDNVAILHKNPMWCQVLHGTTQYFMLSSYMWTFAEGLHLYLAMTCVCITDRLAMVCFIGLGWVIPLITTVAYTVVRFSTPGATERCWMEYDDSFLIIDAPVMITLLVSLVFLTNILWITSTKIPSNENDSTSATLKTALRASFTLVPLFALQYLLYPFRPAEGTLQEKIFDIATAILTSFQGLFVGVLFCFLNQDIFDAIKALVGRNVNNEATATTGITTGESVANAEETIE